MADRSKLLRKLSRWIGNVSETSRFEKRLRGQIGRLNDDGTVTVEVQNRSHYVWVQIFEASGSTYQQVYLENASPTERLPVFLERTPQGFKILGVDEVRAQNFLTGETAGQAAAWHSHELGYLYDPVSGNRLLPLLVHPNYPAGLSVYIEPGVWEWEGQAYSWTGGTVDLSGSVPGSSLKRLVVIGLNPADGQPVIANGPTVSTSSEFTVQDALNISFAYRRLFAVPVENGQTEIVNLFEFIDLRPHVSGWQNSTAADAEWLAWVNFAL